jgi:hypothetical protein
MHSGEAKASHLQRNSRGCRLRSAFGNVGAPTIVLNGVVNTVEENKRVISEHICLEAPTPLFLRK